MLINRILKHYTSLANSSSLSLSHHPPVTFNKLTAIINEWQNKLSKPQCLSPQK